MGGEGGFIWRWLLLRKVGLLGGFTIYILGGFIYLILGFNFGGNFRLMVFGCYR